MVRRNKPSAGEFAQIWDQLPPARQRSMIAQLRAALAEAKDEAGRGAEVVKPDGRPHVRSGVTVLNSARRAGLDDAWTRLAKTAHATENGRPAR